MIHNMEANDAADFEMLLIEELVGRRFVRKRRIAQLVVENVVLPVARDRTLEVDEDASGPIQVDDPAVRAMRSGLRRVGFAAARCVAQSPRPRSNVLPGQAQTNAEIDAGASASR